MLPTITWTKLPNLKILYIFISVMLGKRRMTQKLSHLILYFIEKLKYKDNINYVVS